MTLAWDLVKMAGEALHEWASDRFALEAETSIKADIKMVEQIGCIGCVFTVKNRGKRPAKIRKAWVARKDPEALRAFEEGFDRRLAVWSDGTPPPVCVVYQLLPLPKPEDFRGAVLERDDAVRFLLPVQITDIGRLLELPSQDIEMGVTLVDDTKLVLLKGLEIQDTVRDLLSYPSPPSPGLRYRLEIELQVETERLPSEPPHGKINQAPIVFGSRERDGSKG